MLDCEAVDGIRTSVILTHKNTHVKESVDDEDEVLFAIADELGNFTDLIGGPAYAHILFGPLSTLAATEETLVRDKVRRILLRIASSHTTNTCNKTGRRVSSKSSLPPLPAPSRRALHPSHEEIDCWGVVHVPGLGLWVIRSSLPFGFPSDSGGDEKVCFLVVFVIVETHTPCWGK